MQTQKIAAQFAAYVWFENVQQFERSEKEKSRFAKRNWESFVGVAPEGLGRLLHKIAAPRSRRSPRHLPGLVAIS